jgi:hypothetical protein
MPWINLTLRRGAISKQMQHAAMARLTEALMFWEKVPGTPTARRIMKGWVYESPTYSPSLGRERQGGRHEFYLASQRGGNA